MFHRRTPAVVLRFAILAALVATFSGFSCEDKEHVTGLGVWKFWGGNLHNTHQAEAETTISAANVHRLQTKWIFETAGNVSAIPTVSERDVYVTDWGAPLIGGGKLHAIDRESGKGLWSKAVLDYSGNLLNTVSRSSPAIAGDLLVFGDVVAQPAAGLNITLAHGATLYAVKRSTGDLVWKTQLDSHPLSTVTQSPVVYDGVVYVGTSSLEEAAARVAWSCCTFRGSMLALELATGKILWKTYMTPDNFGRADGFSGNAIWGSSPSIDAARGVVYIATGNNYTFPADLENCIAAHRGDPASQQTQCYDPLDPPNNYADSVVALDLRSGAVRWAQKFQNYGAWTFACDPKLIPFIPNDIEKCEDIDSLDFDFGQAPMIYTTKVNGLPRDLLGVGQKSGVFYALDPNAGGKMVWATTLGPGGPLGGMEFGAATDGERIYVQNTNFDHIPFKLVAGPHAGETATGGIWAALDAATGAILWETPDPSSTRPMTGIYVSPTYGAGKGPGFFAAAMGPMTVANGVVYAGSMDPEGHMYGMNAKTGQILWSFESGGSVMSAPSIVEGVLYWGSGYSLGFNSRRLYAFALPR